MTGNMDMDRNGAMVRNAGAELAGRLLRYQEALENKTGENREDDHDTV